MHAQNPLVVIDKNLAKTDLQEKIASILVSEGIKFTVFDKVEPEPRIELADEGASTGCQKQMRHRDRYRRRLRDGRGQGHRCDCHQ
ncbi:MAG: iron-containing alcohol dehydrogenase [Desulfosudis oleivorans]|nr:iron-containing alcohol dehydrogenase [Desulfosudis oleivorans]